MQNFPVAALSAPPFSSLGPFPTIVSAKMWAWMLNDQFGILNDIFLGLGLIGQKIAWTASPDTAMIAVLVVDVWKTTPFMALLILAGLQMVPG